MKPRLLPLLKYAEEFLQAYHVKVFNFYIDLRRLGQMTQYKEKSARLKEVPLGNSR